MVTGYTGEWMDATIYFQLLNGSGSKIGQSFIWQDYDYAGDPNDPDDPPASYHGWYGKNDGLCYNSTVLAQGDGVWFNAPSSDYKIQTAGAVAFEAIPVELRKGFKMVANACPRDVSYGEMRVTGYTGEWMDATIYFQLLNGSGSKIGQSYIWQDYEYAGDPNDPDDPPASYHGWYGKNDGQCYNSTTLGIGQGVWANCPADETYYIEFPSAIPAAN